MKKYLIIFLLFTSLSVVGMEHQAEEIEQSNTLERLTATVSYDNEANIYYVDGCGPVPTVMMPDVLNCKSVCLPYCCDRANDPDLNAFRERESSIATCSRVICAFESAACITACAYPICTALASL